jgi:5-methyltetrahydrofolate--homocysteine methyltransferase
MMLKGANFEVIDLGTNVPAQTFIEAIQTHGAKVVGLSALLTTTMPAMKATVAQIRESHPQIKIMVGGAPITQAFASEISADGFSPDAASAVDLARTLTQGAA